MVEVSQFIDSFPTAVSDYTQASGPASLPRGKNEWHEKSWEKEMWFNPCCEGHLRYIS